MPGPRARRSSRSRGSPGGGAAGGPSSPPTRPRRRGRCRRGGHPRRPRARGRAARTRLEVGGEVNRRGAECPAGVDEHATAEDEVARAADHRSDAEGQRLADPRGPAAGGELADEGRLETVDQRADGGARKGLRDHLAPGARPARPAAAGLRGELRDQVDTLFAEHERQDERASAVGVVDSDAVHLGDRLGVQRGGLEEAEGLDPAEGEGHARADPRYDGRRADGGTAGGHRGEVAPLEDREDLGDRGVRVAQANAAQMREDDGALHRQHAVQHADRPGVLRGPDRRQSALPGRVVRQGVDAVHLLGHVLILHGQSECPPVPWRHPARSPSRHARADPTRVGGCRGG